MDPESRRARRREQLRKKRQEKQVVQAPQDPQTPEEVKRDALMKLKNSLLKAAVDAIAVTNTGLDKLIENNTGDMAFFKVGEFLEELDRQLKDPVSECVDFYFIFQECVALGLVKEDELDRDDLLLKKKEWGLFISFLRKEFLDTEVASFLNTYHQYY